METPEELGRRMAAVIGAIGPDTEQYVRPHLEWAVQQILRTFYLEQLTDAELSNLAAVLIPIHSRFLVQVVPGHGPGGPGRRLGLVR